VPAIVHMAHNSQEEGNALADVLSETTTRRAFGPDLGEVDRTIASMMAYTSATSDYSTPEARPLVFRFGQSVAFLLAVVGH